MRRSLASSAYSFHAEALRACADDDAAQLENLIDRWGADVDFQDEQGRTVLMYASAYDSVRCVSALLTDSLYSLDVVDTEGCTALHLAARFGAFASARILLKKGATINRQDRHGRTPLHWAVESKVPEVVAILVKDAVSTSCDLDAIDAQGYTPLMIALERKYLEPARILLKKGASLNIGALKSIYSIFHFCMLRESLEGVELLAKMKPNFVTSLIGDAEKSSPCGQRRRGEMQSVGFGVGGGRLSDNGNTIENDDIGAGGSYGVTDMQRTNKERLEKNVLMGIDVGVTTKIQLQAKQQSSQERPATKTHTQLNSANSGTKQGSSSSSPLTALEKSASGAPVVSAVDDSMSTNNTVGDDDDDNEYEISSLTPLHLAVADGRMDAFEVMIKAANVHSLDAVRDREGRSFLHWAVIANCLPFVSFLLRRGMSPDVSDPSGVTALHLAAQYGAADFTQQLLLAHATTSVKDNYGRTPLMWAIVHQQSECVALLLAAGANGDDTDHHGFSAMHYVADVGNEQITEMLITARASLDLSTETGLTPLMRAIIKKQVGVVRFLLQSHTDATLADHQQWRAIHFACASGSIEIVRMLYRTGGETCLQVRDIFGAQPLHEACRQGHAEVVAELLHYGVDVTSCTYSGFSPLHVAAAAGHKNVCEVLLSHGAYINAIAGKPSSFKCFSGGSRHKMEDSGGRKVGGTEQKLREEGSSDDFINTSLKSLERNHDRHLYHSQRQHKQQAEVILSTPLDVAYRHNQKEVADFLREREGHRYVDLADMAAAMIQFSWRLHRIKRASPWDNQGQHEMVSNSSPHLPLPSSPPASPLTAPLEHDLQLQLHLQQLQSQASRVLFVRQCIRRFLRYRRRIEARAKSSHENFASRLRLESDEQSRLEETKEIKVINEADEDTLIDTKMRTAGAKGPHFASADDTRAIGISPDHVNSLNGRKPNLVLPPTRPRRIVNHDIALPGLPAILLSDRCTPATLFGMRDLEYDEPGSELLYRNNGGRDHASGGVASPISPVSLGHALNSQTFPRLQQPAGGLLSRSTMSSASPNPKSSPLGQGLGLSSGELTARSRNAQIRLATHFQERIASLKSVLEKTKLPSNDSCASNDTKSIRHSVRMALRSVRQLRSDTSALESILDTPAPDSRRDAGFSRSKPNRLKVGGGRKNMNAMGVVDKNEQWQEVHEGCNTGRRN